ncbi:MAG: 50S ribosomal protein L21 [Desulfobulbales bacterium]|nr:50S ribosomal protein L21 [Desulfobulbales bacterium]
MKEYEKMTVKELIEELTALGVTFNKKSRKAELLELLLSETGGKGRDSDVEDKTAEIEVKAEAKEKPAAKAEAKAESTKAKKPAGKKRSSEDAAAYTGYAIIRTGGKQYQVSAGTLVRVEKIAGNVGDTIELKDVLAVVDGDTCRIGQPTVEGAVVTARIVEQGKEKKVLVFKKKRRKGYRVKRGHRQLFTALEVSDISL